MPRADIKVSDIIRGYAQAILSVAEREGMLDKVEQELTRFKEVVEKDASLQEFPKDPRVTSEGKQKAVAEILRREVSTISLHHISMAIEHGRAGLLLKVVEDFFSLAAASRRKVTAEVTTAVPLSEETGKKMENLLSEMIGEAVFLKTSVDPSLLGGMVIRVGERIIDGSIRSQFRRLKERISKDILTGKGRSH